MAEPPAIHAVKSVTVNIALHSDVFCEMLSHVESLRRPGIEASSNIMGYVIYRRR